MRFKFTFAFGVKCIVCSCDVIFFNFVKKKELPRVKRFGGTNKFIDVDDADILCATEEYVATQKASKRRAHKREKEDLTARNLKCTLWCTPTPSVKLRYYCVYLLKAPSQNTPAALVNHFGSRQESIIIHSSRGTPPAKQHLLHPQTWHIWLFVSCMALKVKKINK